MKRTLVMTLVIEYETNGTPIGLLEDALEALARRAAGNGDFTAGTVAEVETWTFAVGEMH